MINSYDKSASLREADFQKWLYHITDNGSSRFRTLENIFLNHNVKDPFPVVWNKKNSGRLDSSRKWTSAWTEFLICLQETINEK